MDGALFAQCGSAQAKLPSCFRNPLLKGGQVRSQKPSPGAVAAQGTDLGLKWMDEG